MSDCRYAALAEQVNDAAASLPPVLCGFSACIDRVHDLDNVADALQANGDVAALGLKSRLEACAAAGKGGEFPVAWSKGQEFFAGLASKWQLAGGTGTQVANQLALIGASPALSLQRRDPALLDLLHPNIILAPPEQSWCIENPGSVPRHDIIEFPAKAGAVERADRVILRFGDDAFELDEGFAALDVSGTGAAVFSGFNALQDPAFDEALDWAEKLAADWREAGLALIHLELAEFEEPGHRRKMFEVIAKHCTSLGMSLSELENQMTERFGTAMPVPDALVRLAGELGLHRVNVHADQWALSFTRLDPERERVAIEYGCLLASSRAAAGHPVRPVGLPAGAKLNPAPWPACKPVGSNGWLVSCAAPHHINPVTTIGLGDSFLAGTLAVLAQARNP